eukprot:3133722-Pyramimonas_sp.AAC.1
MRAHAATWVRTQLSIAGCRAVNVHLGQAGGAVVEGGIARGAGDPGEAHHGGAEPAVVLRHHHRAGGIGTAAKAAAALPRAGGAASAGWDI